VAANHAVNPPSIARLAPVTKLGELALGRVHVGGETLAARAGE